MGLPTSASQCSMGVMEDPVIQYLQTANMLRLSRETGLARSTLQRLKRGYVKKMTPGTRRLILDAMKKPELQ